MELGRIELPSIRHYTYVLRPFPTFSLTQGDRRVSWPSVARWPANRLSESSSVFPDASSLFRCHPPLLVPGCGGSAPCAISGHDVSLQPENQAARANCWLAILFFAPFNDSEQIGSHARPPELMSKPVSPNNVNALFTLQVVDEIVVGPCTN